MKPSRMQTIKRFADRGMKSYLTGIFANMALSVTKCMAGLWGHSTPFIVNDLDHTRVTRKSEERLVEYQAFLPHVHWTRALFVL
jgi:hypothetical protein